MKKLTKKKLLSEKHKKNLERKNEYFIKRGYTVVRVRFENLKEAAKSLSIIMELRDDPKHPKAIIKPIDTFSSEWE